MAQYIYGSLSVQGLPRNGATARLYDASAFVTPPQKNTALPASGLLDTVTTGPAHGGDGAYRFSVPDSGAWWVAVEWNGLIVWDYHRYAQPPQVDVTTYGAIGNFVADDTAAVQAAINALTSGGTVTFPNGTFRLTSRLTIPAPNIILKGTGKRNPQGVLPDSSGMTSAANLAVPTTLYVQHTSGAIWLSHTKPINGFRCRDLTVLAQSSSKPAAAFDFDLGASGTFRRDFIIEDTTIQGFTTAILLHQSSTESGGSGGAMGVLRVLKCSIMHNTWIAQTNNSKQWNGFVYLFNDSGQNGQTAGSGGGLQIRAHAVNISNNILEGQADPIAVSANFHGLTIKSNYLESVSGTAPIQVSDSFGPLDIGPNIILTPATTYNCVLLTDTGPGVCLDPYWVKNGVKITPHPNGNIGTDLRTITSTWAAGEKYSRVDPVDAQFGHTPLNTALNKNLNWNDSTTSPLDGVEIPVQTGTTSGTGIVTQTETIAAASGQWVVISWLLCRNSAATTGPYVSLRVNNSGSTTSGSADQNFLTYYAQKIRVGEWALITMAVQPQIAMTSLVMNLYPFGISPASGLAYAMRFATVYVVNDINDLRPFFSTEDSQKVSASPASGTWHVGSKVFNSAPASGSAYGWVNVASGTPGTWRSISTL